MSAGYDHPAAIDEDRLLADCQVRRGRASGPGGQHRNKVETMVIIRHCPTDVTGMASERRSQQENRIKALFRLRVNLALHVRRDVPRDHTPTDLWQSRCQKGQVHVNAGHRDFPAMLAEALDVLQAHGFDPPSAAAVLGCSPSQLVKLLKAEPAALAYVNERRQGDRGLHPLK